MSVTLVLALMIGAPGAKNPPPKADRLFGIWVMQSVAVAGTVHPEVDDRRWEFLADGTHMRYVGDEKIWKKGLPYSVEPRIKPAALNIGEFGPSLAIYKIDGDTLTICVAQNARKTRPTDFETPKDMDTCLYVFKRLKTD